MGLELRQTQSIQDVATVFLGVNVGRAGADDAAPRSPLVNIKDLRENEIAPLTSLATIGAPPGRRGTLADGDVLVAVRGTLLKSAIVGVSHVGALASSNLAVLRPYRDVVLPQILHALFLAPEIQQNLLRQATGAVITGLQLRVLKELTFWLPPMAEQRELAALADLARKQRQVLIALAAERDALANAVISSRLIGKC